MQFKIDRTGLPVDERIPPEARELSIEILETLAPVVDGHRQHVVALAFTLAVAGLLRRFALPGFSGEALALVSAQLRREAERDGPLRLMH